jgi:uncharacterized protein YoxC
VVSSVRTHLVEVNGHILNAVRGLSNDPTLNEAEKEEEKRSTALVLEALVREYLAALRHELKSESNAAVDRRFLQVVQTLWEDVNQQESKLESITAENRLEEKDLALLQGGIISLFRTVEETSRTVTRIEKSLRVFQEEIDSLQDEVQSLGASELPAHLVGEGIPTTPANVAKGKEVKEVKEVQEKEDRSGQPPTPNKESIRPCEFCLKRF